MPAFTFEKLPPPPSLSTPAGEAQEAGEPKRRGLVIQILDRFVERRIQRTSGGASGDGKDQG
jgi:hypothetical protein